MLFKIINLSNKQTLINSVAAKQPLPHQLISPFFSLIDKNIYMYMLNMLSMMLLVYNIIIYLKFFKFRAISYKLMCMLYFLFVFLLLFLFICILFHSMCSVLSHYHQKKTKKKKTPNFHTTVKYHKSM